MGPVLRPVVEDSLHRAVTCSILHRVHVSDLVVMGSGQGRQLLWQGRRGHPDMSGRRVDAIDDCVPASLSANRAAANSSSMIAICPLLLSTWGQTRSDEP